MGEIILEASEVPPDLVEFFEPIEQGMTSVLKVSTEAFPGAHFATFPRKVVEPCVLAGTSEKGVCPRCGAPWGRVVERESMIVRNGSKAGSYGSRTTDGLSGTMVEPPKARTIGWQPSCSCPAADPVPAIVLDPFAGSGTTGVVALAHGRRFVGLDLSAEYLDMAARRISRPHAPVQRTEREENLPLFDREGSGEQ